MENREKEYMGYDPNNTVTTSYSYPHSDEFEYESRIELIDFDKEREMDIARGKGFIIEDSRSIKKDLKAEDGIFSPKFGQTLSDVNPFIDRYKCACGKLKGHIHSGMKCPECGKICRYVDDDFSYFGWMVLADPYYVIHPAFYKKLESFLGKGVSVQGAKRSKLDNIIDINNSGPNIIIPNRDKDADGNVKDEPFFGIGMMEFQRRFDEVIDYYIKKKNGVYSFITSIYNSIKTI